MKEFKKVLLLGFFIWLIPFIVSFFTFNLKDNNRALFESIMLIVLTACIIFFSVQYFSKETNNPLINSIFVSIVWFSISLLIDLILFMPKTQLHMSLVEYIADIGLTYLIIPIIVIGIGYLLKIILKSNPKETASDFKVEEIPADKTDETLI